MAGAGGAAFADVYLGDVLVERAVARREWKGILGRSWVFRGMEEVIVVIAVAIGFKGLAMNRRTCCCCAAQFMHARTS